MIITKLLGMLSIQNHIKFQLFIRYSVKILIFIYLMNQSNCCVDFTLDFVILSSKAIA
jgi:hypothetical protein